MGGRYASAQGVYREVQERNEGVKQIEKTLMELNDLFTDVRILPLSQFFLCVDEQLSR